MANILCDYNKVCAIVFELHEHQNYAIIAIQEYTVNVWYTELRTSSSVNLAVERNTAGRVTEGKWIYIYLSFILEDPFSTKSDSIYKAMLDPDYQKLRKKQLLRNHS